MQALSISLPGISDTARRWYQSLWRNGTNTVPLGEMLSRSNLSPTSMLLCADIKCYGVSKGEQAGREAGTQAGTHADQSRVTTNRVSRLLMVRCCSGFSGTTGTIAEILESAEHLATPLLVAHCTRRIEASGISTISMAICSRYVQAQSAPSVVLTD